MSEKEEERNLETTTSSMDVASLNNLIVSMRGVVKRCRVQVVNKLTHMIKKYRNKKGSEAEMLANQRKAERLLQEIDILKGVHNDKIAKFALANTLTVEDAARQGGSVQTKVLTRMACHKPIQTKVLQWRKEHDDWSSLAAFILTKNTGRRFKKKKTKKPQKGQSANPKELAEAETIESYKVTGKLDKVGLAQGARTSKADAQTHKTVDKSEDSGSDSEGRAGGAVEICATGNNGSDEEADTRLDATSSSEQEDICSDGSVSAPEDEEASEEEAESDSASLQSDSASIQSDSPTAHQSSELLQRKQESVTKVNRTSKEMVIRKLDLSSLGNEDLIDNSESGPGFLFAGKDSPKKSKSERAKDPFFVASSDEEAEDKKEEEEGGEEGNEEEDVSGDSDADRESRYVGMPNLDSMFLGNLSSQHSRRGSHRGRPLDRRGWGEKRGRGRGMRGFPRTRGFSREGQRKDFRGRGGQFDRGSRGRSAGQHFDARRTDGPRQPQVSKSSTNKPTEDEKLHPSWEASKKRKQQHNTIQPFQGKKIKFGEDS